MRRIYKKSLLICISILLTFTFLLSYIVNFNKFSYADERDESYKEVYDYDDEPEEGDEDVDEITLYEMEYMLDNIELIEDWVDVESELEDLVNNPCRAISGVYIGLDRIIELEASYQSALQDYRELRPFLNDLIAEESSTYSLRDFFASLGKKIRQVFNQVVTSVVVAAFSFADLPLSAELLAYERTNKELDSVYYPINTANIINSSVYTDILDGEKLVGTGYFGFELTHVGLDNWLSIHAFRYSKTPNNSIVEIRDRYDYDKDATFDFGDSLAGESLSFVVKIANDLMANIQSAGTLTPYQLKIDVDNSSGKAGEVFEDWIDLGTFSETMITLGKNDKMKIWFSQVDAENYVVQAFGEQVALTFYGHCGSCTYFPENDLLKNPYWTNTYCSVNIRDNWDYVIVELCDQNNFGTAKLVITPYYETDSYYQIYSINCNNFQFFSCIDMNQADINTLTVSKDGKYKFELPIIKNVILTLFILDPRAVEPTENCYNSKNNTYVDIENGYPSLYCEGGCMTKTLTANIPYFLIITMSDNSGNYQYGGFDFECTLETEIETGASINEE